MAAATAAYYKRPIAAGTADETDFMGSRLGSVVIQEGLLTVTQLQDAFTVQVVRGGALDTVLLEKAIVDEASLLDLIARQIGYPEIDADLLDAADAEIAALISSDDANRLKICPLLEQTGRIAILVSEETNPEHLDALAATLERQLLPFASTELRILQARQLIYGTALNSRYEGILERLGERPPISGLLVRDVDDRIDLEGSLGSLVAIGEAPVVEEEPVVEEATVAAVGPVTEPDPSSTLNRLPLGEAIVTIRRGTNRDEVLFGLMQGVHQVLDHVRLFAVQRDTATGLYALDNHQLDRVAVRENSVSLDVPSIIAECVAMGKKHTGVVPDRDANATALVGAGIFADEIAIAPLIIRGRTICVLVGFDDGPMPGHAAAVIEQLTEEATEALKGVIVKRKLSGLYQPAAVQAAPQASPPTPQEAMPATTVPQAPDETPEEKPVTEYDPEMAAENSSARHAGAAGSTSGIIRVPEGALPAAQKPASSFDGAKVIVNLNPPAKVSDLLEGLDGTVDDIEAAIADLESRGQPALDILMTQFPGPLSVSQNDWRDCSVPPVHKCGPILHALLRLGPSVQSSVLPLTEAPTTEVRFFATYLLSQWGSRATVVALGRRVQDEDPAVRRIALRGIAEIHRLEEFPAVLHQLRGDLEDSDPRVIREAIEGVSAAGDSKSLEKLIDLLDHPEVSEMAAAGLSQLTKQNFSPKSGGWMTWWEENGDRHRIEWLIDGLGHENPNIQYTSGVELEELSGMDLGFQSDLPGEERAKIVQQYRMWWQESGSLDFGRFS